VLVSPRRQTYCFSTRSSTILKTEILFCCEPPGQASSNANLGVSVYDIPFLSVLPFGSTSGANLHTTAVKCYSKSNCQTGEIYSRSLWSLADIWCAYISSGKNWVKESEDSTCSQQLTVNIWRDCQSAYYFASTVSSCTKTFILCINLLRYII